MAQSIEQSIEISCATFHRLQELAVPLVDTFEDVIVRMLDLHEGHLRMTVPATIRQFDPFSPPSLTHTKVLEVEFCGRSLKPKQMHWSDLLKAAVLMAASRAKTSELKSLVIIPYVHGLKNDEGYFYLSEVGISFQEQSSNVTWKAVRHIAKELGLAVTVTFVWREKEGAAFPV